MVNDDLIVIIAADFQKATDVIRHSQSPFLMRVSVRILPSSETAIGRY
jgi:hypothetical protein